MHIPPYGAPEKLNWCHVQGH